MKAHALVPQDVSLKKLDEMSMMPSLTDFPDEGEVLVLALLPRQFRNTGAALGSRMEAESYMFPRSAQI